MELFRKKGWRGKRTAVGVALDGATMQAVELADDGTDLQVRRVFSEPMPENAFTDGELTDADAVADAVHRLFRAHHLPNRNAGLEACCLQAKVQTTGTSVEGDQLQGRLRGGSRGRVGGTRRDRPTHIPARWARSNTDPYQQYRFLY